MTMKLFGKLKIFAILGFAVLGSVFAAAPTELKISNELNTLNTFESGAELFKTNCARCHGSDGKGGKGPNLASEKRQAKWRESDAKLVRKIEKGGLFMPSFGKKLKAEEIKAIADHVRSLKE